MRMVATTDPDLVARAELGILETEELFAMLCDLETEMDEVDGAIETAEKELASLSRVRTPAEELAYRARDIRNLEAAILDAENEMASQDARTDALGIVARRTRQALGPGV